MTLRPAPAPEASLGAPATRHPANVLSRAEFVAMMAVLFATVAFSIDAMLPALPEIAATLSPDAPNAAQLVLTAFVMGMGMGTLVAGPLSDAVGRKPALTGGIALYLAGAAVASQARSLETLVLARVVQGIGAAGPRIVSQAMIRDLFEGRRMAQIMSFVMMVFVLIPAIAPALGALIISVAGWRGVFGAFVVFGLVGGLWINLRQPETLPAAARRRLRVRPLREALTEVLGHRDVRIYIAVLSLGYGQLFALLSSVQQIYDGHLGRGDTFPLWFMATALLSGAGMVLNAGLVMRLGMRRLTIAAFTVQAGASVLLLAAGAAGLVGTGAALPAFFLWSVTVFLLAGLTFGNLNALALQPMGHIAGMAASVVGAIATVAGVLIAVPIGLMFDGTPVPLVVGTSLCSILALLLMLRTVED